jgi:hypothetical protein
VTRREGSAWIAALLSALGMGASTYSASSELALAEEAIRAQTSLARECLIQLGGIQ